ncbi:protein POF1B [Alligator mississippiensis]|uniref:protein POF1B n=1 Tax=Alligator mississippiensis TaxID=8496 RepID=UPI002877C9B1|nr:protein POF1B [Alligator mississippiensis]
MYGSQQQLQPPTLPPHLQPLLPCGSRPASPCPEPLPLRRCPSPCPEPLPLPLRRRSPCPEPLPLGPPPPPERTYGPGCRRPLPQVLEPPACSPCALSPPACTPGCHHVISSCDPPQEIQSPNIKISPCSQGTVRRIIIENPEQEPLSPFLRGGSFCPGNNVIYEKTIRKYEYLNPQKVSYQIPLQSNQCHVPQTCQQTEQSQITQQCQQTQTGIPCEIIPIPVCGDGRERSRVTVQTCEPVPCPQQCMPCPQQCNDQLDCRYFGELLAELNCKSNDLYTCLLQHVDKLGRRKHNIESHSEIEDIECLIPKGLSESTKQLIRYILQMRVTSDKSLRLVLSTFSSLREELCHLQGDLGKLETENMLLKKDFAFKESQAKEYETLLASLRENNRQQQQGLRENIAKCRSLEEQILSLRHGEGEKECHLKELEYSKRALEQEIQNLRRQTCSSSVVQSATDELSSRYVEMINNLREDKDRVICNLRSQLSQYQQDVSKRNESNSDLQIKLHELTSKLEDKEVFIKQQEEELFKLKNGRLSCNHCPGVTRTVNITRYRNQYPILGLLSDDFKATLPGNQSCTTVVERTGDSWKRECFTST